MALSWAAVALLWAALAGPASAAPALHVIPFPGTPDASPLSHIIFSSLQPSELASVTVRGSASGLGAGHLVALPDGAGTAFLPDHAFAPGEQVRVTADLSSAAAGTASGDPGATVLNFSFTIAVAPSSGAAADRPRLGAFDLPGRLRTTSPSPVQNFRSTPGLHPPIVSASADPDATSGDIFLTPHYSAQEGPMILDGRGRLVWFRPVDGFATNLEVQHYRHRPVLTWFQQNGGQRATNEDVIMDQSYRVVGTLHGVEGYVPDEHEFQLTSSGTAWIDAYALTRTNLTSVGGSSDGVTIDCLIQERDVKTGELLWEWHALGHIPVNASFTRAPTSSTVPYDFFHLNSIQQLPNGNLLISARNTWSVYEIDKRTGGVIWTLGGKDSSFKVMPGAGFEWQHDAHLQGNGILSLFDDGSNATSHQESQSSAKTIKLGAVNMTASLVHRYVHRPPLTSEGEGGAQVLANHNVFVGWGNQPAFTEYTPDGRQIFSGTLPLGVSSYRAYRFRWQGQPATRPSVSLTRVSNGEVKVYVSWNGATDVATWRVQGGSRPSALHSLDESPRTGFETTLILQHPGRYLAVQALSSAGKVLARTAVRPT